MRKFRGSMVAVIAMASAVLAGAACSGGGSADPTKFRETECSDCIGAECSTEIAACNGVADCADALECALDCPEEDNALDITCVETKCTDLLTSGAGVAAFDAVVQCYLDESPASGTCGSQCAPPTE